MTRWVGHELVALHRLLALEDVADPDGAEAGYIALIDPGDPMVTEICLLTDGLEACLRDLTTAEANQDAPFAAAA